MLRYTLILATVVTTAPARAPHAVAVETIDVRGILQAAAGAPRILCALAARAVRNGNWGGAGEPPVTPLGVTSRMEPRRGIDSLTTVDRALLLAGIDNPDPCVRELSVRMMGYDESGGMRSDVARRLVTGDSGIREAAAFALGLLDPEKSTGDLIHALKDNAAGVRANAAWALGRADTAAAFRPLLGAATDPAEIVRVAAVESIGHTDSSSAIPILGRLIRTDPSPLVRRSAAWALGEIGSRDGVPALVAALADHDADVREMSAWAIGDIGGDVVPPALLGTMEHDSDGRVREMAVWAAAEIGDHDAAPAIARVLSSDHETRTRATAAWALGELGISPPPRALIDALSDTSARVRTPAAWAISQGDANEAAIPALKAALAKEHDANAEKAEIRALVHNGGDPEQLATLLESKDPTVRVAVTRALAGGHHIDPWPWPQPRPRPFP